MTHSILTENELASFPERLRDLLSALGWNQSKLANEAGITVTTISRWMHGKQPPSTSAITKIVESTNCSPAWLVSGEGPMWDDGDSVISEQEAESRKKILRKIMIAADNFFKINNIESHGDEKATLVTNLAEIAGSEHFHENTLDEIFNLVFPNKSK